MLPPGISRDPVSGKRMETTMRKRLSQATAISVAMALSLAASPSFADEGGVNVGSLSCRVASGVSFIFGSSRNMNCVFTRPDGKKESYSGEIKRYGVDIGYVKSAEIVWGVFAPSGNVAPGSLAGTYLGVCSLASAAGLVPVVGAADHSDQSSRSGEKPRSLD